MARICVGVQIIEGAQSDELVVAVPAQCVVVVRPARQPIAEPRRVLGQRGGRVAAAAFSSRAVSE